MSDMRCSECNKETMSIKKYCDYCNAELKAYTPPANAQSEGSTSPKVVIFTILAVLSIILRLVRLLN